MYQTTNASSFSYTHTHLLENGCLLRITTGPDIPSTYNELLTIERKILSSWMENPLLCVSHNIHFINDMLDHDHTNQYSSFFSDYTLVCTKHLEQLSSSSNNNSPPTQPSSYLHLYTLWGIPLNLDDSIGLFDMLTLPFDRNVDIAHITTKLVPVVQKLFHRVKHVNYYNINLNPNIQLCLWIDTTPHSSCLVSSLLDQLLQTLTIIKRLFHLNDDDNNTGFVNDSPQQQQSKTKMMIPSLFYSLVDHQDKQQQHKDETTTTTTTTTVYEYYKRLPNNCPLHCLNDILFNTKDYNCVFGYFENPIGTTSS